ncbi:GvpL/GvpF family gas vesicle protein [Streptomyces turgidiscabies]|uniref:Gas vesicle protein, GvpL/GvpF family n=1 Tax=Streptomyces turgidiscabies (strain Car8) TaxID=698760 RepID=L7F2V1_STRT8|nr:MULTISPECIES: GvpL/GvpF family gas vesicle protein [Streptomyces]ELP65602.1 gas vesicle protein, GvpL/GvpF family [Streptomyces turgidiscabies Car8]MDX3498201.1 GvpL/GvpF family gas vesicle protein [Streptomyces turgidiscabies]GAQ75174.1 Gas vesicle synthesis protein GvpL/GvpF [Streptomyces turgidiscabies]
MALYVYAITGKEHPHRVDGLTGVGSQPSPVRTVTAGPLSAVVSDISEEIRPKRRDLQAHQEVLESLMADAVVLPLQFGYLASDDQAVQQALKDNAEDYIATLARLDGCAEYHVRASQVDEDELLRQILSDSPEARELNEQIRAGAPDPQLPLRLGELVAREVQERQDSLAAGLVHALIPYGREHTTHPPSSPDFVNLSLLVPHDRTEEFLAAQAGLARQIKGGVEFRLTGPLPPYSFVQ